MFCLQRWAVYICLSWNKYHVLFLSFSLSLLVSLLSFAFPHSLSALDTSLSISPFPLAPPPSLITLSIFLYFSNSLFPSLPSHFLHLSLFHTLTFSPSLSISSLSLSLFTPSLYIPLSLFLSLYVPFFYISFPLCFTLLSLSLLSLSSLSPPIYLYFSHPLFLYFPSHFIHPSQIHSLTFS